MCMLLVPQDRRVKYLEVGGMKKYDGQMMKYAAEALNPI
jgi:hypothetical protein